MPEYSTAVNPTFSLNQLADTYKIAFDTNGFGTGKINIQGGYQFTASQVTDAETSPIEIFPDGTVNKPASIINMTEAVWVDNFMSKNFVYPVSSGSTRWILAFYLPGASRFRIKFTPFHRPGGGTTGNFSEISFYVQENQVTTNPSNINGSARGAQLQIPTGTYTVGTQYTTGWSHGTVGALSGAMEAGTIVLISCQNVVVRIDSIEYVPSYTVFGVQSPNLDSPLWEFKFLQSSTAHGYIRAIPQQNAWTPRILLLPGINRGYHNVDGSITEYNSALFADTLLYGMYRDDNIMSPTSTVGIFSYHASTIPVTKNFSFGTTVNIYLANNTDYNAWFLRSTQSSSVSHVYWDRILKSETFPTTSQVIQNRRANLQVFGSGATASNTGVPSPLLFQVLDTNKVLRSITLNNLDWPGSANLQLYRVSVTSGTFGKRIVYEEKIATIPMTGSGGQIGSANSGNIEITLVPGYYLLTIPYNTSIRRGLYAGSQAHNRKVKILGPVDLRSGLGSDTTWVSGSTILSVGADATSSITNNDSIHFNPDIALSFLNTETPSTERSSYAEGWVLFGTNPIDGNNSTTYYSVPSFATGDNNWTNTLNYGMWAMFGVDLAVNSIPINSIDDSAGWWVSPLPGYLASARSEHPSANPLEIPQSIEFVTTSTNNNYSAWLDKRFRHSLKLRNTVVIRGTSVAPGLSYVNADNSKYIVISTASYGGGKTNAFHLLP